MVFGMVAVVVAVVGNGGGVARLGRQLVGGWFSKEGVDGGLRIGFMGRGLMVD